MSRHREFFYVVAGSGVVALNNFIDATEFHGRTKAEYML